MHGSQLVTVVWGDGDTTLWGAPPLTHVYNAGGVYAGLVIDSAGCGFYITDTVPNFGVVPVISLLSSPVCDSIYSGGLAVSATGGTPPYTYRWFNGSTSDSVLHLQGGDYSVTVSDNAGCSESTFFHLAQLNYEAGYYVYGQVTPGNCGANGQAIAVVYGGTPPFTYLWNNQQTTDTITGLASGVYEVTVTDVNGCVSNGAVNLTESCYNVITGTIFNDANGNCVQDSGDAPVSLTVNAQRARRNFLRV